MEFLLVAAVVLGVIGFVGWLLKSDSAKEAGEKMTGTAGTGCTCLAWVVAIPVIILEVAIIISQSGLVVGVIAMAVSVWLCFKLIAWLGAQQKP